MRSLIWAAAIVGVWATSACRRTGEGDYETQKPTVDGETGAVRDTNAERGERWDGGAPSPLFEPTR